MSRPSVLIFHPSRAHVSQWATELAGEGWDVTAVCDAALLGDVAARSEPWVAIVPWPLATAVRAASSKTEVLCLATSRNDRDEARRMLPHDADALVLRAWIDAALRVATLERALGRAQHELEALARRAPAAQPARVVDALELPPVAPSTPAPLSYTEAKACAVRAFETAYLTDVLARAAGSISGAARLAGLDRCNFRRLVKRALGGRRRRAA